MSVMQSPIPVGAPETIREECVQAIMQIIASLLREDIGNEDQNLFKVVLRGDPDDMNLQPIQLPGAFIEDGEEEKVSDLYGETTEKRMIVLVHIRFPKGQGGVDPFRIFNYYLGRVQQAIMTNYTLGGKCRDIDETASSPQVFNRDNAQGGFLALSVRYAHQRNDPKIQR